LQVEYSGRGYGFVMFETAESMQAAAAAANVTTSNGEELIVEESNGRSPKPVPTQTGPNTTIYVKNLPEMDDAGISGLFDSFGTITRVANLTAARGFAFVSFETEEQMQGALAAEPPVAGENALVIEEQKRPARE
jgi:RNA recognition motif-containing protein